MSCTQPTWWPLICTVLRDVFKLSFIFSNWVILLKVALNPKYCIFWDHWVKQSGIHCGLLYSGSIQMCISEPNTMKLAGTKSATVIKREHTWCLQEYTLWERTNYVCGKILQLGANNKSCRIMWDWSKFLQELVGLLWTLWGVDGIGQVCLRD